MLDLNAHQLDIKTALLKAKLEEIIYMKPVYDPVNLIDSHIKHNGPYAKYQNRYLHDKRVLSQQNCVLRLKKVLYGLKQAPQSL